MIPFGFLLPTGSLSILTTGTPPARRQTVFVS